LLAYLGLGPTALAYFCYCAGMARCRSAISGLIATMIEPMVAAVLAMTLLHERLDSGEFVGCLLLMLAMAVLWQGERPAVTIPLADPAE
jgi:drug/metabolite transporter, DME family